ncbi:MAG: hypothetical protein WAM60_06770, partial [Candidatus Promineifilaceae bacterium]
TEAQSGLKARRLIPIASLLILIALWFIGLRFAYESFEIYPTPDDPLAGQSLPRINGEVSCQRASSLPKDDVIYLTFQNKTDRDLAIYWVNDDGEEIYYNIVNPGERWLSGTYVTHAWCFREVETGLPVFAYVVTADSPQIVVIPPAPE